MVQDSTLEKSALEMYLEWSTVHHFLLLLVKEVNFVLILPRRLQEKQPLSLGRRPE